VKCELEKTQIALTTIQLVYNFIFPIQTNTVLEHQSLYLCFKFGIMYTN